ncbi:unnamed protein product [Meganyctiphanes norvegica]|uniref:C-type lectin domain-containing protein n=1 Tax=Meganyctiphanes norvegica TaxID=48144 RepID=A0AAV2QEJ0_MEGNR
MMTREDMITRWRPAISLILTVLVALTDASTVSQEHLTAAGGRVNESLQYLHQQLQDLASAVQELQSNKQGWLSKESLMYDEQMSLRQDLDQCRTDLTNMDQRVVFLEGEVNIINFLQSTVRDLQEQDRLMYQEVSSISRNCQACRGVGKLQRKVENLSNSVTDLSEAVDNQLPELHIKMASLDTGLQKMSNLEAETAELQVSVGLALHQLSNVTQQVEAVATHKEQRLHKTLVLCPDGYQKVGSLCLQLVENQMSWEEARSHCRNLGIMAGGRGELAVPEDIEDFRNHIRTLQSRSNYLWVGGHRDEVSGWQWTAKEGSPWPADTFPWDKGEPDNRSNQIHLCIKSHSNLKFHDCQDTALLGAICQIF